MTVARLWFATTLLASAFACRSPKQIDVLDVMAVEEVCDSTQAETNPAERGPILPGSIRSGTSYGVVVGTAEESVSRHPFYAAPIDLYLADTLNSTKAVRRRTGTDAFGGFLFDSVSPGVYVVRGRFIAHQPADQRVTVEAGSVDTVRLSLRRYVCYGH